MLGLMQQQPLLISSLLTFAARHHGAARSSATRSKARAIATPTATPSAAPAASPARSSGWACAGRPGRHAGLERLPPLRALLRRLRHGCGHATPSTRGCSTTQIVVHRRPRRGPGAVRRPDLRAAGRAAAPAACHRPRGRGRDDRPRAHAGAALPPASRCMLRGPAGRGGRRLRLARARRELGCGLCYTSGTTGQPKGVLYSHRSTVLHAYGAQPARRVRPARADRVAARRRHVPRQRLGHPLRRDHGRRHAGASPAPDWTAPACTS